MRRHVAILAALAALALAGPAGAIDSHTTQPYPSPCVEWLPETCEGQLSLVVEQVASLSPNVCYRYLFHQWDSWWFVVHHEWHHYFHPVVCANGQAITGLDRSSHWQEVEGWMRADGIAHPIEHGCVGCRYVQIKGVGHFRMALPGAPDETFDRCIHLRVWMDNVYQSWTGC